MKLFLRLIHISFLLFLVVLVGCATTEEIKLLNQGIKNLDKGQYDKAISDFTKAIEINPSAEAYYRRGVAYDYPAGHGNLRGEAYLDPKSAEAYDRSMDAYFGKAISDFNKAIELNPKYAEAYYRRGVAYNNKIIRAAVKSAMMKKIDPKYTEAFYRAKDAYKDKAFSDFTKTIELNPDYPEAYIERQIHYDLRNQYDKAKADLNMAMVKFYERAISYQEKGQDKKACIDYRTACAYGYKVACGEFDVLEEKGFCERLKSYRLIH